MRPAVLSVASAKGAGDRVGPSVAPVAPGDALGTRMLHASHLGSCGAWPEPWPKKLVFVRWVGCSGMELASKIPKAALVLVLVLVAPVGCAGNSSAACGGMASSIRVESHQVPSGGTFEVRGEGFGELVECDDAGSVGGELEGARFEPRTDITIELRQGSKTWGLVSLDADRESAFREKIRLPEDAVPGRATVTADGNQGTGEAPISVVD